MEDMQSERNNTQETELTPEQTARLAAFRQKLGQACRNDSAPRQRTTVKKLLGVRARVRIVADMEDGTHFMLGEVWPSTTQPMLDVLNHVSHRFRHDDGDDVVTWEDLRNRTL